MKLHDTTIGHVARLVQMAILTGTDVVDHLRVLTLQKGEEDYLYVEEDYQKVFDEQIGKMLENASSVNTDTQENIKE